MMSMLDCYVVQRKIGESQEKANLLFLEGSRQAVIYLGTRKISQVFKYQYIWRNAAIIYS